MSCSLMRWTRRFASVLGDPCFVILGITSFLARYFDANLSTVYSIVLIPTEGMAGVQKDFQDTLCISITPTRLWSWHVVHSLYFGCHSDLASQHATPCLVAHCTFQRTVHRVNEHIVPSSQSHAPRFTPHFILPMHHQRYKPVSQSRAWDKV